MVTPRTKPDLSKLAGLPAAPPIPDQGMAKYFTAALLEAARNECQCTACQLLRKASQSMTQDLLEE